MMKPDIIEDKEKSIKRLKELDDFIYDRIQANDYVQGLYDDGLTQSQADEVYLYAIEQKKLLNGSSIPFKLIK